MKTLFAFDNDGVLRDESVSYNRCVIETVAFFDNNIKASEKELIESMKQSNDDWERTHKILSARGIKTNFEEVKEYFQDLYIGKKKDFSGYINDEPWLADNDLLEGLAEKHPLIIISGAPKEEIEYTLKRNNAQKYFSHIWGMFECKGKDDGLEKAISKYKPEEVFFCDDRPSAIKKAIQVNNVQVYGIIPPNVPQNWDEVLKEAGAKEVFQNVREYCKFILNNQTTL